VLELARQIKKFVVMKKIKLKKENKNIIKEIKKITIHLLTS
jgi:hypothetical protein